jgi:GNAT superfamily N-acetyltransferase
VRRESRTKVDLQPLAHPVPAALAAMTFPVYRQLLDLAPTVRHPEQGDERQVQPVGVAAFSGAEPVGLVLGEVPVGDGGPPPEMLSLFVAPEWRGHGVATALVAALESEVARRGHRELDTVYTAGKPSIGAVERILWKRAWVAPESRTLSVRFAPAAALASNLFDERRMAALGAALELFPWSRIGDAEKAEIRASHERAPWITPALAPWRFERAGFDPDSSIGARYRGAVVGWVLNHKVSPEVVRFTCSFMRKDISRRGRIVPLYHESLKRLAATDCRQCTFITPVVYPNMIHFIERWILPIADFAAETRGSKKALVAP